MAEVLYTRTSHISQKLDRQYNYFKDKHFDKIFEDKGWSGKNTERPAFKEMMAWLRAGDTLYVEEMSRLGRSLKDILDLVDELNNKGVGLVMGYENLDTSTPTGMLMLQFMGAIVEFERKNMLRRQAEGIELAKEAGKYKGRKPVSINENTLRDYLIQVKNGEITKTEVADKLCISRKTLYTKIRQLEAMEVI